ncbi:MAG: aldo/keto reductase [gamma proteobacterium symbiont of Taylorina sp.]|nr:aldo/keto reductase [gamma proteobacterium symbiont of Taylorina sp.]
MKYIPLADSQLKVSEICLGTMTFGQQNDESQAHQQLDYALESGINFIDTAEMYPVPPCAETVHRTEQMVGSWLTKQNRESLVIATKMTGAGRGMSWVRNGQHQFNRNNIRIALDASLKRLQTDYIDLYQLHWPERNTPMFGQYIYNPDEERDFTPIKETLEALAELVEERKIRYIGLSNEWPWGVMQFLNIAREFNLPRIVSIQNAYSLLNRTYEMALLEFCHRENISLNPYSPLAFGYLSGKYHNNPSVKGRVTLFDGFAQRYNKPNVPKAVAAYVELAEKFHLSPAELALGFVYSRWFTASTIIGATKMEQLKENIAAYNIQWSEELEIEVQKIQLQFFNPAP